MISGRLYTCGIDLTWSANMTTVLPYYKNQNTYIYTNIIFILFIINIAKIFYFKTKQIVEISLT